LSKVSILKLLYDVRSEHIYAPIICGKQKTQKEENFVHEIKVLAKDITILILLHSSLNGKL
jgi:hypothetical protein